MTTDSTTLRRTVVSLKSILARKTREMIGSPPRPLSYDMFFKDPKDGCAPRVLLAATHEKALETVTLEQLKRHAVDLV